MAAAADNSKNNALLWLNVHYVLGEVRKRISFPPGMLVSQARDLCMLRFGVWQEIMQREADAKAVETGGVDEEARSMSTQSTASSGSSSREQYGLYWPARAQWLGQHELMTAYRLETGDRLELQDHNAFIATQALQRRNNGGQGAGEPSRRVEGEGQIYYMQSKSLSAAWKLCWLELSGTALACYKRGRLHGSKPRTQRDQPIARIDLSAGFKLADQHGRQNQRISTSDQLSPSSSAASLLGLASYQHLGGSGAPLIIKCSDGAVHVFCTQSAVDYDYWRRMLRLVQTVHELPTNITLSSGASCSSGLSSSAGPRNAGPLEPAKNAGPLEAAGDRAARPPNSGGSSGVATSLVHRPHMRRPAGHIVARPKCDRRFGGYVRARVCGATARPIEAHAAQRVYLAVVPHALFGFSSEYSGDAAGMDASAEFRIGLGSAACVHQASEQRGDAAVFVVCILRAPGGAQADVEFGFEVDSCEQRDQWVEALRTIGGVSEAAGQDAAGPSQGECGVDDNGGELDSSGADGNAGELDSSGVSVRALGELNASGVSVQTMDPLGGMDVGGLSLRRSRSFVSTLSRADWPLPPTTLPSRLVQSVRTRGKSVLSTAAGQDAAMPGGNPSLDAVGLRIEPQQRQQSRFPWFRRNIMRPGSGADGSQN
ncbi:hypothetical protein GGF43_000369 [Coemansia sp. RSA 2618]|nr:hypothetical protein GGF43_000369 [Coemansia sp. RSA 2618]